jgi:hypothetical protein
LAGRRTFRPPRGDSGLKIGDYCGFFRSTLSKRLGDHG